MTQHSTDTQPTTNDHVQSNEEQTQSVGVNEARGEAPNLEPALSPPGPGDHPDAGAFSTNRNLSVTPLDASSGPLPRVVEEALGLRKKSPNPPSEDRQDVCNSRTDCPVEPAPKSRNRHVEQILSGLRSKPKLPPFTKPATLSTAPTPALLRKPRSAGLRANRRSPEAIQAERELAELQQQALLPSPDQIPQPAQEDPQALWKKIREVYATDPVGFTIDILGVTPDDWQAHDMAAIGLGERRLSVRAGHGVGKTAFCSWLVVWHMVVRFPQKTVITAATASQLEDALISEMKKWANRLPPEILSLFEIKADRIELRQAPVESFVSARTSSRERPQALAGVHCDDGHVLLICDEASDIPEAVFEAAGGSMSQQNASMILIGNPTRNSGLFHASHTRLSKATAKRPEDRIWRTSHVSCIGSKRASPIYAQEQIATYGDGSNAYRVRVLGEFPDHEDDVLIPAINIDTAITRDIVEDQRAPLIFGIDVSRFGDDRTVICKRRGNTVLDVVWWSKKDTMESVARIIEHANRDKPDELCIDSIGIGAGVADRLRQLHFNVRDVNVSEASAMNANAHRLRDDLWMQVRDWFETKAVKIVGDDRLIADLKAPTYTFSSLGKLVVESKADMKKRGLPSPDFADALCMTFAGQAALIGGRAPAWSAQGSGPLRRNLAGVV